MINREKYCIANFKMNLASQSDLMKYFTKLNISKTYPIQKSNILIAPPFVALNQAVALSQISTRKIEIGAQNINSNSDGAYTGEISASMVADIGVSFVILGHSERREYFNETDSQINNKINLAFKYNLKPIFCIGETLEERESNLIKKTLKNQIVNGLNGTKNNNVILAYEPIWAIGTGKTATPDIIIKTHLLIRNILNDIGFDGEKISILYGGSVNRNNAKELIKLNNVDGFLIGGASLDVEHFFDIYKIIEESI